MIAKIESKNEKKTEAEEETWVKKKAREWEESVEDGKILTKKKVKQLKVANQLTDQQQLGEEKDGEKYLTIIPNFSTIFLIPSQNGEK